MDSIVLSSDEKAAAALTPALHILDAFNHRNKNQHRVARWWAQFDLLRRSIRRLDDALTLRIRTTQGLNKKKSKSQKTTISLDEDVFARVRALFEVTIPSSFLAFTQLTADNQHAALGLTLLGVLASINSAIAPLAPGSSENGERGAPAVSSEPIPATVVGAQQLHTSADLGVAISRDQLHQGSSKSQGRRSVPDDIGKALSRGTNKKRKLESALVDEKQSIKPPKGRKAEKKSGKKKKDDEFSDLFSSLM